MRHVRRYRWLANLDGMSVPQITGWVMANDDFAGCRRDLFLLIQHDDALNLTHAVLVHTVLIAHQTGFLEVALHF